MYQDIFRKKTQNTYEKSESKVEVRQMCLKPSFIHN